MKNNCTHKWLNINLIPLFRYNLQRLFTGSKKFHGLLYFSKNTINALADLRDMTIYFAISSGSQKTHRQQIM